MRKNFKLVSAIVFSTITLVSSATLFTSCKENWEPNINPDDSDGLTLSSVDNVTKNSGDLLGTNPVTATFNGTVLNPANFETGETLVFTLIVQTGSPAKPSWLSISPTNGVLSGTCEATPTALTFKIKAVYTKADVVAEETTNAFTINVNPPQAGTLAFVGNSSSLIGNTINGLEYTPLPLTWNGNPLPVGMQIAYSLSPTVPASLSFSTSTGTISGTPSTTVEDTTYTLTASIANTTVYAPSSISTSFTITIDGSNSLVTSYESNNTIQLFSGEQDVNIVPSVNYGVEILGNNVTFGLSEESGELPPDLEVNSLTGAIEGDLDSTELFEAGDDIVIVSTYQKNPQLKIIASTEVTFDINDAEQSGYKFDGELTDIIYSNDFDSMVWTSPEIVVDEASTSVPLPFSDSEGNDAVVPAMPSQSNFTIEYFLNKTLPKGMVLSQDAETKAAVITSVGNVRVQEETTYTIYALVNDGENSNLVASTFKINVKNVSPTTSFSVIYESTNCINLIQNDPIENDGILPAIVNQPADSILNFSVATSDGNALPTNLSLGSSDGKITGTPDVNAEVTTKIVATVTIDNLVLTYEFSVAFIIGTQPSH